MTNLTPLVEDAARAAEEAMRDVSVCEGADGMSYGLLDALAEARCETELSGASDVLRDAALDVSLRTLLAFHNPDSEAGKALVELMARALYERAPLFECGESIDGFRVTPGGDISWSHALTLAAEFGGEYQACLDEHYDLARAALTAIATALKETALPTPEADEAS